MVGLTPPRAMILLRDVRPALLTPFASTIPVGKQETAQGVFTRCDERGATLKRQREVLTFIELIEFSLTLGGPYKYYTFDPQIDAFSFWFAAEFAGNRVQWKWSVGPGYLLMMDPFTAYFQLVRAKSLTFAMDNMFAPTCFCFLRTFRYV